MEITGAESEFVGETACRWEHRHPAGTALPGSGFDQLPVAVQRKVLQRQLADAGVVSDFELIEQLRESPGKFVSVGSNLSVVRDAAGKLNRREHLADKFNAGELKFKLPGRAGRAEFGGLKFRWAVKKFSGLRGRSPHQTEFFDADKIGGDIVLRHWRPGDRFQPIGLPSAVKLQDLFVNAKIPAACRRGLVLATTAAGEIFWVEGLRIGENFKLTPATKACRAWRWVVENKKARV
jgi:tRNA(Ile)-lysidine synthase